MAPSLILDTAFLGELTGEGAIEPAIWGQLVIEALQALLWDYPEEWSFGVAPDHASGRPGLNFYLQQQATEGHFLLTAQEMGMMA